MAQTDYLRYSANSMKDFLVQKLNESGVYTDQLYEDSNLSVLIDCFAHMFSVQEFYLNNTSTEGTFVDTILYENLNRVVKMLNYNPRGFVASTVSTNLQLIDGESFDNLGIKTIPKFTSYATTMSDSNGNPIKFSFVENFVFVAPETNYIDKDFHPIVVNGQWKKYPNNIISVGVPFETITLDALLLNPSDVNRTYLSHGHIYVYVKKQNGEFIEYTPVTSLYNSKATDHHFEFRINEKFQYTLKFGDDINGVRLEPNSTLYVVYLESNGVEGEIGSRILDGTQPLQVSIDGFSEEFIKANILKVAENPEYILFGNDPDAELQKISLVNEDASTGVKDFETVDEIKENAPNWFRMGSRLITPQDFEQYILVNYPTQVYDVAVTNNWEYMTEFQEWLRSYNKLNVDIRHYDYAFSDSCDFNNIYIWLQAFNNKPVSVSTKRVIERDCNRLKPLTSEIVFVDPLMTAFTPYIKGDYDVFDWDVDFENKIQLIRDRNTMITVERIKQRAINIIQNFFLLENNKIGQVIDVNSLYNQLLAIDGVKDVRTKYLVSGQPESTAEYYDGLSFATWTPHIIEGADLTRVSGNYKLKSFQFPFLYESSSISNRVEVSSDTYNVSEIEY